MDHIPYTLLETPPFEADRSVRDRAQPSAFTLAAVSQKSRTVAGYIHAGFEDSSTLKIKHVIADRPHQGKGLGGLLIQVAEKRAHKLSSGWSKMTACLTAMSLPSGVTKRRVCKVKRPLKVSP